MPPTPNPAGAGVARENPPAFPSQGFGSDGLPMESPSYGMSLRDWFAGQALTGALAGGEYAISGGTEEHIAALAYNFADAMITARTESPQS